MASTQYTGKEPMSLRNLTASLHRNDKLTPAIFDALNFHATALSQNICSDFKALNAIVLRHEALIRQRWMKKTIAQRRHILLTAWPEMPEHHRPDINIARGRAVRAIEAADGYLSDHLTRPFINQEDLVTPRTLLLLLNSRARKAPWEFAAYEVDFSPVLVMNFNSCKDETFCKTITMDFTEAVDPTTYGKVRRIRDDEAEHCSKVSNRYDCCARRSFQALLIQERILAFLFSCVKLILHDLSGDCLLNAPLKEEPPASQIIVDRLTEHTSFIDILNMAPYRGWESSNFTKLSGYVQSTLNLQKDHVWALREDPAYFADTVREHLDHSVYMISSTCAPDRAPCDAYLPGYMLHKHVVADMLDESFAMLHGWDFVNTYLRQHEDRVLSGATKQEIIRPILELEHMTDNIGGWLLTKLYICSRAAPACRRLVLRKCDTPMADHQYIYAKGMTPEENLFMKLFDLFHVEDEEYLLRHPVLLAFHLEKVERFLQKSPTARRMISGRMSSLMTDLSIIAEIKRQVCLWLKSPEVETGEVDRCGCKLPSRCSPNLSFFEWNEALFRSFNPPMDLIMPLREQLNYPEHKNRGPEVVASMRRAEDNLDRFWAAIDAHFEAKIGLVQHESIRNCLDGFGKIHRTAPWDGQKVKPKCPLYQEYRHIPEHLHDKAAQITGAFDKMSIVDKLKAKTRGSTESSTDHPVHLSAETAGQPPKTQTPTPIFSVDKRTYNVLRSLFGASFEETGEVPKSAKWFDFKRAIVRMGFAAENLQGSAWQFIPTVDVGNMRGIQFHEPHPDSEITYVIAKRIGRRLGRVYGWRGDMFHLA